MKQPEKIYELPVNEWMIIFDKCNENSKITSILCELSARIFF